MIFVLILLLVVGLAMTAAYQGQCIVVSGWTDSKQGEGTLTSATAPYPGMHAEMAPVALIGKRPQLQKFQTPSQGKWGPVWVFTEDRLQGATIFTQLQASRNAFYFMPQAGDQCNVMVEAASGTSPSVTVGEFFMIDSATGKLEINSSATMVPWQSKEAYVGAAADTLTWCVCLV